MSRHKINYTPALLLLLSIPLLFYAVPRKDEMVSIHGGVLETKEPGTNDGLMVSLKDFYLDKYLVTVGEFEKFQKATGYVTQAERAGKATVFDNANAQWTVIDSADFRYPEGRTKPKAARDHPVTQVSWNDAQAYARWKGKRLPTEWEWEYAARNARQSQHAYTWGSNLIDGTQYKENTWKGFDYYHGGAAGYPYTSPVGSFGENDLGLTDMSGNVWQWCADNASSGVGITGTERVIRGGSFLHDQDRLGFQLSGRSTAPPESSLVHVGFRCARDTEMQADF